jgi:hypothetical protein
VGKMGGRRVFGGGSVTGESSVVEDGEDNQ